MPTQQHSWGGSEVSSQGYLLYCILFRGSIAFFYFIWLTLYYIRSNCYSCSQEMLGCHVWSFVFIILKVLLGSIFSASLGVWKPGRFQMQLFLSGNDDRHEVLSHCLEQSGEGVSIPGRQERWLSTPKVLQMHSYQIGSWISIMSPMTKRTINYWFWYQ